MYSNLQSPVPAEDLWAQGKALTEKGFAGLSGIEIIAVAVSWIAVYQGYHAAPTSEGVSRATTSTVVVSSLAILALDFVLTAFMFH